MGGKRAYWSTRFGFYLAAIGSACGLGNLWRFPFVVGENGGGAFILLYVILALVIGLPLLISELMLGKYTRKSIVAASASLFNQKEGHMVWIAKGAVLFTLVVFSYYAVISGWVLYFFSQFLSGFFSESSEAPPAMFSTLMNAGWLQILLASVHLLICVIVVSRSVQEGLEKWVSYIMPLFGVLVLYLLVRSMSLPSFGEASRFLFYPDFSKLTLSSLGHALGHVFFTLTIGFGSMVTFGSYLKESDHIPTAGFRVTMVDCGLSIVSALLIFAVVLQNPTSMVDTGLLFETLPNFLLQMPGGWLFGVLFFLCLYAAALGASIGLLEVIVSNIEDQRRIKRQQAAVFVGVVSLIVATVPALSSSVFKHVQIGNRGILEIVDSVLINWTLPVVVLAVSWMISKGLHKDDKEKLFVDDNRLESSSLFPSWKFSVYWIAPLLIGAGIIFQFIDLLRS